MVPGAAPGNFSLEDTCDTNVRLRSVARYATFHPQAIACSTPLAATYSNDEARVNLRRKQDEGGPRYGSSVAAVAGPHGVALFRVSRPHTPLVVLSHASSKNNSAGSISSLSFQPHTKDSLLLAAARGSGVLVWDASGHSLSPLLGRIAMEPSLSSSDRITSISWIRTSTQSLLATTNATNACLWDLRTSLRAHPARPTLRLGAARKVNGDGLVVDPLVQIAASNKEQVATLDGGGAVHVFDIRMTDRPQGSVGEVSMFPAFLHAGIGLQFLPSNKEDTCWVTWGLDAPQSDAIVKVWSDGVAIDDDSYWFMDGSPESSPKIKLPVESSTSVTKQYRQTAEFSTPYLACARVSPEPFENQVVTVGMVPGKGQRDETGWQADVWELKDTADDTHSNGTHYGAEKMSSFGVLHDNQTASMIGTNANLGSLRGAELALEPSEGHRGHAQEGEMELDDDYEGGADLLLCCLTSNGYVTEHVSFLLQWTHVEQGEPVLN